ncbi:MAG: hypothetical protein ABL308_06645 [Oceanicaulis sp.]
MIRRLVLFALCGLAATVLSACGMFGDCENEILDTVAAPGEAHEVRVWRRNCGATSAYSFHFELAETGAEPGPVAHRERVFLIGKGAREDYAIAWVRPRALTVGISAPEDFVYNAETEISIGETVFQISYRRP